jgi:hypothetical protein
MAIRLFTVVGLVLLLLGQSLREGVLRIWHSWERESFARVFCVNIDEPAVMCYGQCQIDELDAERDTQEQDTSVRPPAERLGTSLYWMDLLPLSLTRAPERPRRANFLPVSWQSRWHAVRIFRPPLSVV